MNIVGRLGSQEVIAADDGFTLFDVFGVPHFAITPASNSACFKQF